MSNEYETLVRRAGNEAVSWEEKFSRGHFNHRNYKKKIPSRGCDTLVSRNLRDPDNRETGANEARETRSGGGG